MKTEIKSGRLQTTMVWRFLGVMLLVLCMPMSALAHIIERIEVQRAGDEAEIIIRFDTQVQYQRHSPLDSGSRLNIYFNITGVDPDPTGTIDERRIPKGELISGAFFRYPELDSSMLVEFPVSTTFRVRQGSDARSISIFVPIAAATSAMLLPPSADAESMARDYLAKAKSALNRKDPAAAIETLNSLLNLPPNASSQEAQELIGMAYEQNGESTKARTEYEYYIKTYPKGEGAARVNERLAKLAAVPAAGPAVRPVARPQEETGWQVTGGFGQTRYYGKSSTILDPLRIIVCSQAQLDNPALVPVGEQCSQTANANAVNPQTTARTDQNSLVSSLDFAARNRSVSSDSRFVVRDIDTRYYLENPSKPNINRLNAAYYEQSNRDLGYMMRLGRQTASGGGILGRFDGAVAGYSFSPNWRLNGVAGSVVEFNSPYDKTFYGANIDLQPASSSWSGNLFAIQQQVGSKTDRQAVGFEARYFDAKKNGFVLIDYDTSFEALNIAMFQANYQSDIGTSYYLSLDHRRSPVLMLTSASDATQINIDTLISTVGDRAVRQDIVRITPMTNMLSAGLMHPYSTNWQLGGDFQVSSMGSTEASQNLPIPIPAQKATGNTYIYSARAIGSGMFFASDMTVFSGSYIDAKKTTGLTTYSAQSYAVTHVARPAEGWQLEATLRLYYQDKSDGEKLDRINPVLRALYHLKTSLSFEAEVNQENETKKGGPSPGSSNRRYYYAGYRWDF